MTRVVEVAPERYPAWRERFEERNADLTDPQRVVGVETFEHDLLGLILVRRGGYAIGQAKGESLVEHKVGTAYVQSRTKKGGWSQQRYARRRGKQADELVTRVRDHAARLLIHPDPQARARRLDGMCLGGDRQLLAEVLEDPRLTPLRSLPTRELYDLPDPRLAVLRTALERARAVRVTIEDPG